MFQLILVTGQHILLASHTKAYGQVVHSTTLRKSLATVVHYIKPLLITSILIRLILTLGIRLFQALVHVEYGQQQQNTQQTKLLPMAVIHSSRSYHMHLTTLMLI